MMIFQQHKRRRKTERGCDVVGKYSGVVAGLRPEEFDAGRVGGRNPSIQGARWMRGRRVGVGCQPVRSSTAAAAGRTSTEGQDSRGTHRGWRRTGPVRRNVRGRRTFHRTGPVLRQPPWSTRSRPSSAKRSPSANCPPGFSVRACTPPCSDLTGSRGRLPVPGDITDNRRRRFRVATVLERFSTGRRSGYPTDIRLDSGGTSVLQFDRFSRRRFRQRAT